MLNIFNSLNIIFILIGIFFYKRAIFRSYVSLLEGNIN